MKTRFFILLIILTSNLSFSQTDFQSAYTQNNLVPSGLLEAVAWTNTHMVHLDNQMESCSGIPMPFGIMGLHDNGKNYFIETAILVETLSGISVANQKLDQNNQILAYATAFQSLMSIELNTGGNFDDPLLIKNVLYNLSEIPDSAIVNQLARDMQVFSIFSFMNDADKAQEFNFTAAHFNLAIVFGVNNFAVLSSPKVSITATDIHAETNEVYTLSVEKSAQYGPAIWNPAPSCNYSSRSGTAVSAITIHTIQGSYAGAISWSQNCSSNVSFHYVIRSSDGQVTQMVLEENKGWHVGSENPYTIGYEHEGYVDDASWYTQAMYQNSADLSRDITNSGYGISPLRTYYGDATVGLNTLGACVKIKGHQHFVNQSHVDPGINWDWEKYYKLINNNPAINIITSNGGSWYDTGGLGGDYQDDERELWLFQPANSSNITLDFIAFNLEVDYDYLFIYDGSTTDAPLIGKYTGTNSPGTVSASGTSLLVEFRSDCGTTAPGWEVNFTSSPIDATPPTTAILQGNLWQTTDFIVDFNDADTESGVANSFYLVAEKNNGAATWSSNATSGFLNEDFEENSNNWTDITGTFSLSSGMYSFGDVVEQNSNSYADLNQVGNKIYLYHWQQTFISSDINQRAGVHFFCDDATLPNRGNSYFVYIRENNDKVQIYSVDNDIYNLETESSYPVSVGTQYDCKVVYNPSTGKIECYINDIFVLEWTDPTPLTSGNAISLRSGGCAVDFDDIHVYVNRTSQETIVASPTGWMSVESENAIPTGLIRTVIIDNTKNWSNETSELYLLDFSAPIFNFIADGVAADIDTFYTTTIDGNWNATDIHSDILENEYAIGTGAGLTDVINWTNNAISESFSEVLASPIINQVYYITLRSTNNAGLIETASTDGQRYVNELSLQDFDDLNTLVMFPNPAQNVVKIKGLNSMATITVYDATGRICLQAESDTQFDISTLSNGTYSVIIQVEGMFVVKSLVKR